MQTPGVSDLRLAVFLLVAHDTVAWNRPPDVRMLVYSSCLNDTNYTPPRCKDHPTGYGCDCGAGFHWNTEVCMSTAVDSRLEFSQQRPLRYTLLTGKAFPKLQKFTIAFWIKVPRRITNGTILSYKHDGTRDLLHMRSGPTLGARIRDQDISTNAYIPENQWVHIAWTWSSESGESVLYMGGKRRQVFPGGPASEIPLGGEFVLGQASRDDSDEFDESTAFIGDLTHLHIWSFVMTDKEVDYVKTSCDVMYCGDAVQWTEFRRGTRGAMRMRWPSGAIRSTCYSEDELGYTCNKYCSNTIGAQCNEQIVENIRWTRTPALNTISVPCPADRLKKGTDTNTSLFGTRPCNLTAENEGEWDTAFIDNCISESLRSLKYKFKRHLLAAYIEVPTLLALGRELVLHTSNHSYGNPVDVATVIDMLEMFVHTHAQVIVLQVERWYEGHVTYAKALQRFPTLNETREFIEIVADIVNNVLHERHEAGWNATQPPGTEGDSLLQVLETFTHVAAQSLENHVTDGHIGGRIGFEEAYLSTARAKIEFSVQAQWVQIFRGARFPSRQDAVGGMQIRHGSIELPAAVLSSTNDTDLPPFIKVSGLRVHGMTHMLPNHDLRATGKKAKENNLNTPIIALFVYAGGVDMGTNITPPITFTVPYLDTFNISNPECVRLEHGTILSGRISEWNWTRGDCELKEDRGKEAVCACSKTGIFAVTTDMYNDNWNKGEVRPILMNFASYIGCCLSIILCLTTCLTHIYYRTSSGTASLHKNLGVSVMLGQSVFMIGIDQYDHVVMCQVFAVCLHYFFLAAFAWLMNEAFNLYIVITYSSHSHDGNSEAGSMLRYYILGWVLPAVLVGSFVGSLGKTYYARDMCWISWDNLWLFVGPALGIIAVTIMVMIFTAKEHNENSYTKSEKSNKTITLLMKGLWTQIILITVAWAFAFGSLKMHDRILKYIFGLFNGLQGAFFLVFYLLLNEEIRNIFKVKKKRKTLSAHGYDDADDRSLDSHASTQLVEKDRLETLALDPRPRRRRDKAARNKRRQKHPHDDDEERIASDCEMITSV
ncbi:adhesion G protein-coupled receptor L2-like [Dreissena polymorpha]|uniref:adhesion G protein-coupled receptor L2-like n=1 Tax=Dreissena polymorpha TaxID=45954 RepID=UPI0022654AED|nr:adhesion G protein-coupled receptor L2-like [Dreissena polymorpha]XP_052265656.1 adhesion G protein-coupled receptor L2-like [Dreissena polymorpha]XP_052265657.1 adhesion G protein-coupled receptor L2-like [Dreissena polymorpha]XP_052265658.1 adhesion G protein-coupled receptor L2-like [Dreissena polymorpha]